MIVGIRGQESLNRHAAITSKNKVNQYQGSSWILSKQGYTVAYPIYDWLTEDIWICNAKFNYNYNKVYDLMYKAGLSINQMRVASPFNDYAQDSLKLYKVIDPNNWGKMISRVNGVNFTGIYGGTTAMGWNKITKPKHFTWKQYMEFLLNTLPNNIKANYLSKLNTSIEFWKNKGGALSEEVIKELDDLNIKYSLRENNYNTNKKSVKLDYLDNIDITEYESEKRKKAIEKYSNIL